MRARQHLVEQRTSYGLRLHAICMLGSVSKTYACLGEYGEKLNPSQQRVHSAAELTCSMVCVTTHGW